MMDNAQYLRVTQAAAATIKSAPGFVCGALVVSSTSGSITIYDGINTSGPILYTKAALAAGEVIDFGPAVQVKTGIHVVVGGTAVVNVLYR